MKELTKPIVAENEIMKAEDISFGYDAIVNNIAIAIKSILSGSDDDFVIGGRVTPYAAGGLNVSIEPIFAYGKDIGCAVEAEKIEPVSFEPADASNDRIDIIEMKIEEEPYDTKNRAMYDPFTETRNNYTQMATKKRIVLEARTKKGTVGSPVAPQVDAGFVKLAEVVIPAGTLDITPELIRNITARKSGAKNSSWTADKTATFNPGYIADIANDFLHDHNEDGSHRDSAIKAASVDFGVGNNQVKGLLMPSGQSLKINKTNFTAQKSVTELIAALAENINSLYLFANNIMSRFAHIPDLPVACSTENVDIATGGEMTIDGVHCTAGQMVLLKDQADPKENGFWQVQTGAWRRCDGYDEAHENAFCDKIIEVVRGEQNEGKIFYLDDSFARIGVDDLNFKVFFAATTALPATLLFRDYHGRAKIAEPEDAQDIANRKFVIKSINDRTVDGVGFDGSLNISRARTATVQNNLIVLSPDKPLGFVPNNDSAIGTTLSVYLNAENGYTYLSGVASEGNTVNRIVEGRNAKIRVYTTSRENYIDLPLVIGGEYAGEGCWAGYDTMRLELRKVKVKTATAPNGTNCISREIYAWVATEAQIIYKGECERGHYSKQRGGKIEQWVIFIDDMTLTTPLPMSDKASIVGLPTFSTPPTYHYSLVRITDSNHIYTYRMTNNGRLSSTPKYIGVIDWA